MNGDPLMGTRRYVGDALPAATAHLVFVRSLYAHALVRGVDMGGASAIERGRIVLHAPVQNPHLLRNLLADHVLLLKE